MGIGSDALIHRCNSEAFSSGARGIPRQAKRSCGDSFTVATSRERLRSQATISLTKHGKIRSHESEFYGEK